MSTRLREVGERSETDGSSPGFTGQSQDNDLGLVNMKGRLYDPAIGRFISADPFVANPMSALGWDRYAYVENNPLAFVDPSGFDPYQIYNNDQHYEFEWSPPAAGASGSRQGQGQASGGGHAPSSSGASGGAGSPQATGPSGPTSGPSGAGGPAMGQPAIAHPGNHPIAPQPTAQPTPPGQSNTAAKPACDELCRSAPPGGYGPAVTHDLFNRAAPQIDDSHKMWTALGKLLFLGAAPVAGPAIGLGEAGLLLTAEELAEKEALEEAAAAEAEALEAAKKGAPRAGPGRKGGRTRGTARQAQDQNTEFLQAQAKKRSQGRGNEMERGGRSSTDERHAFDKIWTQEDSED